MDAGWLPLAAALHSFTARYRKKASMIRACIPARPAD